MSSRTPSGSSSSRRENGHSRTSSRSQSTNADSQPAVESSVTRLLMSIKLLLESLTHWSELKADEMRVSDVYVRLGNDFNAAVSAFGAFNIDMNELMNVPDDLRNVLEQCLAEDPSKENLEIYLPTVRSIITNLLQGLRRKQDLYRRVASDQRRESSATNHSNHERTESRSSRVSRSQRSQESGSQRNMDTGDGSSRRSRRREPSGTSHTNGDFVGGFSPQIMSPATIPEVEVTPETVHRRDRSTSQRVELEGPAPGPSSQVTEPPPNPQVPANVTRYSLIDQPMIPPVLVEPSSPDPEMSNGTPRQSPAPSASTTSATPTPVPTPPPIPPDSPPGASPAIANSLAALKKSDALERRASKRFSTYTFSKMTGGSSGSTPTRPSRNQSNRRSMAASSALTPNELAVLTEVDDEGNPTSAAATRAARSVTPDRRPPSIPPTPPLPKAPTPEPTIQLAPTAEEEEPTSITVFLQLGRDVKKVSMEPGLSLPSLRMLFMDRFSYSPGLENFPAIYIRDPSSGVQYELEDIDDIKEKSLLSLNIEPLDQIKQHIDSQMSALAQDIRDLRTTVATNAQRTSYIAPPSPIIAQPLAESTPRPTDKQFHSVARRLSRYVGSGTHPKSPTSPMPAIPQQMTGALQAQSTGSSVYSEYSARVVTDLKTQFDEVQNLRRDLGVMRQVYSQFAKQTKETLSTLRTQTHKVKDLASEGVGGSRAFIENGKKSLDSRTQTLLTDVEKLADTVEGLKADVLKRQVMPKPQILKNIKTDVDNAAKELASIREHIMMVKPMWKKTWQEELQNIVEEQQFLNHEEELLGDLLEDHKAIHEIFERVEKVINLRGSGKVAPRARSLRHIEEPSSNSGGLDPVLMAIRTTAPNTNARLKAIEENQKAREMELANRTDELHSELTDFVGQKKLKMTGGAEEAERVRQKRNDQTLKAMFAAPPPEGA